jgi:hypothetical protein
MTLDEFLRTLETLIDDRELADDDPGEGNFGCEDCRKCNHCRFCVACDSCEDCTYCEESIDCTSCTQCKRCVSCEKVSYCEDCRDCQGSRYLTLCVDCHDCVHCLACVGLEGAEFHVLNQKRTRKEYFALLRQVQELMQQRMQVGWRPPGIGLASEVEDPQLLRRDAELHAAPWLDELLAAILPAPAPAPEPEPVAAPVGLYGQDPHDPRARDHGQSGREVGRRDGYGHDALGRALALEDAADARAQEDHGAAEVRRQVRARELEPDPHSVDPHSLDPYDPRRVDPRQVDPRQVDPRQVDPRQVDPRQVDSRQVDPRGPQARGPGSRRDEPAQPAEHERGADESGWDDWGEYGADRRDDRAPIDRDRGDARAPRSEPSLARARRPTRTDELREPAAPTRFDRATSSPGFGDDESSSPWLDADLEASGSQPNSLRRAHRPQRKPSDGSVRESTGSGSGSSSYRTGSAPSKPSRESTHTTGPGLGLGRKPKR